MKNISLGRYLPYNTIMHRLDPRVKLFGLITFMALIFFSFGNVALNFAYYFVLLVIVLIAMKLAKVKIKSLFKQLKALWFMVLFLLIINVLSYRTPDQQELFSIGNFIVYDAAVYQTFYILVRLVLMISLTMVLTSSTKPLDLTFALEWTMTPLKFIRFPVHEVAMTMSLALRFIPTLLDETGRIMKAQESRGVDFAGGKISERLRGIVSLIVPLFNSAFMRSDELANAMEARGYNPQGKRTKYRMLKFTKRDLFGFIIFLVILGGGITLLILKQPAGEAFNLLLNDIDIFFKDTFAKVRGLF